MIKSSKKNESWCGVGGTWNSCWKSIWWNSTHNIDWCWFTKQAHKQLIGIRGTYFHQVILLHCEWLKHIFNKTLCTFFIKSSLVICFLHGNKIIRIKFVNNIIAFCIRRIWWEQIFWQLKHFVCWSLGQYLHFTLFSQN